MISIPGALEVPSYTNAPVMVVVAAADNEKYLTLVRVIFTKLLLPVMVIARPLADAFDTVKLL